MIAACRKPINENRPGGSLEASWASPEWAQKCKERETTMKRLWTILIISTGIRQQGSRCRPEDRTETSDRTRIVHLKTALNHLTVIELREPVIEVATGSHHSRSSGGKTKYLCSRRKPMPPRTCSSGRRPAPELRTGARRGGGGMDFAVDQMSAQLSPRPASVHRRHNPRQRKCCWPESP